MQRFFIGAVAAATLVAIVPAHAVPQTPAAQIAAAAIPSTPLALNTTIYLASGVSDISTPTNAGNATSVTCSNMSGVSAQVRWVFWNIAGTAVGAHSTILPHGRSFTVSTHNVTYFSETIVNTGHISQGLLAVQSTQTAVFCTAMIVNAAANAVSGVQLHMVRFNANPGTVE